MKLQCIISKNWRHVFKKVWNGFSYAMSVSNYLHILEFISICKIYSYRMNQCVNPTCVPSERFKHVYIAKSLVVIGRSFKFSLIHSIKMAFDSFRFPLMYSWLTNKFRSTIVSTKNRFCLKVFCRSTTCKFPHYYTHPTPFIIWGATQHSKQLF